MEPSQKSDRAERLAAVFAEAVDLDTASRPAFLDQACGDDPDVRREVESLLESLETHSARVRDLFERLPLSSPRSADRESDDDSHRTLGLVGSQAGHYRILDKLGGGGMGVVYQAFDPRLDRMLALKFLPPHLHADETAKTRFNQEARAASALDHPNICTIHDIGETEDGRLYIAMSYYPGETLKKKIARGKLDPSEALAYAIQTASGLDKAHAAGIIHRDIKPANLLVTDSGTLKIVDFGIAKFENARLTRTGATLGTVAYMSPEQVRGEQVDERSDIWSLGAVLYEMLTGVSAFSGESDASLIYSILQSKPDLELIEDPEMRAVVEVCLRKHVQDRFASASDLETALRSIADGFEVAALPVPRRSRWTSAIILSLAMIAVAMITVTTWFLTREKPGAGPVPGERQMLLVLPFENQGEPEDQYFADGMSEELSMRLSSIKSVGVISRNTANNYRETEKTTPEIGAELGVDFVVGGTVRWVELPNGSRNVRIAPYLTRVSDDTQIWAEAYEKRTADVLDIQKTLALSIARELTTTLDPAELGQLQEELTSNPDAYQEYLKGMSVLQEPIQDSTITHPQEGDSVTVQMVTSALDQRVMRAIPYFQRALELDSTFVQAAYMIARVTGQRAAYHHQHPDWPEAEEMRKLAQDAAAWTRRVAPYSRADLLSNGYYNLYVERDWGAAMAMLSRALDLFEDAEVLSAVAMIQHKLGNIEFSVDYLDRAIELDPENAGLLSTAAQRSHYLRQFQKALQYQERAVEIDSGSVRFYGPTGVVTNMIFVDRNTKRAWELDRELIRRYGAKEAYCGILDFWDRKFELFVARYDSGFYRIFPAYLLEAYRQLGEEEKRRTSFQRLLDHAAQHNSVNLYGSQAWAEAGLGNREAALSKLDDFKDWLADSRGTTLTNYNYFAVHVYLMLGMYDEMFEVLEDDASKPGWLNAEWLSLAFFDPVRDDPRFEEVLTKFEAWEADWR